MFMSNILRIIKLKDIFGEFEHLTNPEKLFIKLHDNLHETTNGVLVDEYNMWVVQYDFINGYFDFNYNRFYIYILN